jgi:hypothetical protein
MCKKFLSTIVSLVAILLMVAVNDPVQAKSNFGGNCTSCHDSGTGDMTINPDPIDIAIDGNGVVTFGVIALPSPGKENRIALEGLQDLGLDASILAGGDNWTLTSGSDGTSYISDAITTTDPYTLDLGIGPIAVESPYDIVAYFVGKGGNGLPYEFIVNVLPEPSADFDDDGDVDGADFLYWQLNDGSEPNLDLWQTDFGDVASPITAASTGVPEPTTGLMLVLGMASLLFRRNLEAS